MSTKPEYVVAPFCNMVPTSICEDPGKRCGWCVACSRDEWLTRAQTAESALATATEWSEEDQALPEDSEIKAARPSFTGNHRRRAEAHRMVSAKRSKAALIDLVNWLLAERDRVSEEATEAAEAARAQLAAAVEALERVEGMCEVPGTCSGCGRPNGIPAVQQCARGALAKLRAAKENR